MPTKTIKRTTQLAARSAMAAHVVKMKAKGWQVDQEFEGDAGLLFECVTSFTTLEDC